MILFDNLAYTKYIFSERSSNKEYISILTTGCNILGGKKMIKHAYRAPTHDYEPGIFRFLNPSNVEATFLLSTSTQRFLKTI